MHREHTENLNLLDRVEVVVDLNDLLRAEMVLIVSALDHFVHELARLGMMEIWRGIRPATAAYLKFSVSLKVATQLIDQSGVD